MSEVENLLKWLRSSGLEYFNKYYSVYNGVVTSTADPLKLGRIQVIVAEVDDQNPIDTWFLPSFMHTGAGYGWFWPPEVKDRVLVMFFKGDLRQPAFYFGSWPAQDQVNPQLGYPDADKSEPSRRGFVTKTGHALLLNEEADKEEVDLIWKKGDATSHLKFLPDGSVEVTNQQGSRIRLDAKDKKVIVEDKDNSNVITMDSSGVKVQTKGDVTFEGVKTCAINANKVTVGSSAGKSAVYGEDLLQWLNSHTHPTGVGPSGPPTIPANSTLLSRSVKVK